MVRQEKTICKYKHNTMQLQKLPPSKRERGRQDSSGHVRGLGFTRQKEKRDLMFKKKLDLFKIIKKKLADWKNW